MVLSPVASPANYSANRRRAHALTHQVFKLLQPEALRRALVEVWEQWIEAFVLGENKALGLRSRLDRSPELECDMAIQGIFAVAFDPLEVDPLEPVGGSRLTCGLRWACFAPTKMMPRKLSSRKERSILWTFS